MPLYVWRSQKFEQVFHHWCNVLLYLYVLLLTICNIIYEHFKLSLPSPNTAAHTGPPWTLVLLSALQYKFFFEFTPGCFYSENSSYLSLTQSALFAHFSSAETKTTFQSIQYINLLSSYIFTYLTQDLFFGLYQIFVILIQCFVLFSYILDPI